MVLRAISGLISLALQRAILHHPPTGGVAMKHYRVNKLTKPDGAIVKRKDILASNDQQAIARAEGDEDCPVCEVWHAGAKVGSITE